MRRQTYKAMLPAEPVPPPKPALLAVLLFLASVTHLLIAALSAAVREAALAPPVPSFLMAARAAAGTVRELWDWAPARTVAMLVVLRTEAEAEERRARAAKREKETFMFALCLVFWMDVFKKE